MVNEEKKKSLLEAQIEKKSQSCDENRDLWNTAQNIVSDVKKHLKRISSQMPNYDIHDEEHSQEIIKIMEGILAYKLKDLSFYELILLYLAAYLHDSGMALPDWEYETLKIVEECDKYSPSTSQHKLKSYFQSSKKPDIAKKILKHLNFKYKDHESYIFIEDSEEKVVENISDLIGEYESFRYEEIAKRNNTSYEDYKKLSEDIRYEFIRTKHHKKAANNIENLNNKIKDDIGSFTKDFLKDLADICQAHCENIERVKELPTSNRTDWDSNDKNNIQFLAEMLRLGDIIHFSSDRAPRSLFSEKLITDERSIKHWKAKEGVKCLILPGKDLVKISFHASCSKPEMYYFLADYIKEIESEISNFDELKKDWEIGNKYNVNIYRKVKNKIECSGFKPDSKLKFTMDQSKILELLMGVQLYKDNFACLREVYQNALDTSKCLLAYNKKRGVSENIDIEFGIGEEEIEGIKRKYIYCLDHGLGMNKDIIKKYLLHIGNSYYKSQDFDKENAKWDFDVKPTSQFGIGILSCYMIADKIGISTIYYDKGEKTSCVLSGISERFYYIDMSRTDEEKIGNHGTIVKLYLKDDLLIYRDIDNFLPEVPLNLMMEDYHKTDKTSSSLLYILFKYIGVHHPQIPVYINIYNKKHQLTQYYQLIPQETNFVTNYVIETETKNITVYTILSLPKKGFKNEAILLNDSYFIKTGQDRDIVFIDGIRAHLWHMKQDVQRALGIDDILLKYSLVNFHGEDRPILSVDRSLIIGMPTLDKDESKGLKDLIYSKIKEQIAQHLSKEKINLEDTEFYTICNLPRYSDIALDLLLGLVKKSKLDVPFPDSMLGLKINDFVSKQEIEIKNLDFHEYQEISRQLIVSKCINSDFIIISNNSLHITSKNKVGSLPTNKIRHLSYPISIHNFAIRADKWEGQYKEYDIVSSFWPIVNPKLFDKISDEKVSPRCKNISDHLRGIDFIADLEPTLINPRFGISESESNIKIPRIGKVYDVIDDDDFYLYNLEINNNKKVSLFAYIAPRKLNNSEEAELKEYEQKDPDYFEGVKNGWSIYFLPRTGYIIRPGICSRKEMENLVREKYEGKTEDITYVNTNDEIVIQGENSDEK